MKKDFVIINFPQPTGSGQDIWKGVEFDGLPSGFFISNAWESSRL
jgi:hypothetical protein